jgi:hypothetical protein
MDLLDKGTSGLTAGAGTTSTVIFSIARQKTGILDRPLDRAARLDQIVERLGSSSAAVSVF